MKIILFSDIHYGTHEARTVRGIMKRKLVHYAKPLVEKLIKKINLIKPDIVINLGDLIDNIDYENDIAHLKDIWKTLQDIKSIFYSLQGNHDVKHIDRNKVAEIMGYQNPTFSIDLSGYHFVLLGVGSEKIKDPDSGRVTNKTISKEDLKWLESDIKTNKLPSLFFLHYGVAEDDMKDNWWFEKNKEGGLLYNRNELKKILKTDKNLLAVFSGHQHWTKTTIENDISYHVISSLVENVNGDGVPEGIWYEVDIEGSVINVKQHYLNL